MGCDLGFVISMPHGVLKTLQVLLGSICLAIVALAGIEGLWFVCLVAVLSVVFSSTLVLFYICGLPYSPNCVRVPWAELEWFYACLFTVLNVSAGVTTIVVTGRLGAQASWDAVAIATSFVLAVAFACEAGLMCRCEQNETGSAGRKVLIRRVAMIA